MNGGHLSPQPSSLCECGHPRDVHTDYDDVPCEGSNFRAPGSFVAWECPGFRAAPAGRDVILHHVSDERDRQDAKWGGIPGVERRDDHTYAAVLGEEFGEVCEAWLERDTAALREELVQVAAVAVAWIEAAGAAVERALEAASWQYPTWPDEPMGEHGLHLWWYRCLTRAGIVPPGTTAGRRMHGARHTAIQRVLDKTGNLKAAQAVAGHANLATTGNVYTDWSPEQTRQTMREVLA